MSKANLTSSIKQPIAIVGLACRFPGSNNVLEFWDNLIQGRDCITDPPSNRLDHLLPDTKGGFIHDIDMFDAEFFGISTGEAIKIDPQQRHLLELTWLALEDAGYDPKLLAGTNTCVTIGIAGAEYDQLVKDHDPDPTVVSHLGVHPSISAARLSQFFDLRGKSIVVNTACSSSLVAIETACQQLWLKQAELAIVGGVNLLFAPYISERIKNSGWLSSQGVCRSFDADADGYVRSEGVGVIVLKSYSQARNDNDRIYAVISDTCVVHNGRGNGLSLPSMQAQVELLQQLYCRGGADIDMDSIYYIETNTTGTKIGDAVELKALGQVIGKKRVSLQPLRVGCLKPNIGHSEGASGMAGIMKVALSLYYRKLPGTLYFKSATPGLNLRSLGLHVQTELEDIRPSVTGVRAGVSSFGFGGANAHVLLQEAHHIKRMPSRCCPKQIFLISAKSDETLLELASLYLDLLRGQQDISMADLSYTLHVRRHHFDQCLAIISESQNDLIDQLAYFLSCSDDDYQGNLVRYHIPAATRNKPHSICFLFAGQCRLARETISYMSDWYPAFCDTFRCTAQLVKSRFGLNLADLIDDGSADEGAAPELRKLLSDYITYLIWSAWGIHPSICFGSGSGQLAAAVAAGILELESALELLLQTHHALTSRAIKPAKRFFYSSSSNILIKPGENADPDLWQFRDNFTFEGSAQFSAQALPLSLAEIGSIVPINLANACLDESNDEDRKLKTAELSVEALLKGLIQADKAGINIDYNRVGCFENCQVMTLPPYPFRRQKLRMQCSDRSTVSIQCRTESKEQDQVEQNDDVLSVASMHARHGSTSNGLEGEVQGLWSRVLGHNSFELDDNFFLIGGDSIAAAKLADLIAKSHGCTMSVALIFLLPTIAEQVSWLQSPHSPLPSPNLVTLQPLGDRSPLYLIHGWGGRLGHIVPLARSLAPVRPVIGIQASEHLLTSKQPLTITVEQLASIYAEQILAVHPGGPIHLVGYSAGGWYAHAVASALQQRGACIGLLAILDSEGGPRIHRLIGGLVFSSWFIRRLAQHLPGLAGYSPEREASMKQHALHRLKRLNHRLNSLVRVRMFNKERFAAWMAGRAYDLTPPDPFVECLRTTYKPPRLPLAVDLFAPASQMPHLQQLWSFYATRGIRPHPLFHSHHDFIRSDLAGELASALEAALVISETRL
ncbi:MAG: beta-ketoacyl synthase N-terminal-like domain-containing protein [Cyanobacteriota bacterium]